MKSFQSPQAERLGQSLRNSFHSLTNSFVENMIRPPNFLFVLEYEGSDGLPPSPIGRRLGGAMFITVYLNAAPVGICLTHLLTC